MPQMFLRHSLADFENYPYICSRYQSCPRRAALAQTWRNAMRSASGPMGGASVSRHKNIKAFT